MSIIFQNYKYNDKYNKNDPKNFIHYRNLSNCESQRSRIFEKNYQLLNDNYLEKKKIMNNKNNQNEHKSLFNNFPNSNKNEFLNNIK